MGQGGPGVDVDIEEGTRDAGGDDSGRFTSSVMSVSGIRPVMGCSSWSRNVFTITLTAAAILMAMLQRLVITIPTGASREAGVKVSRM